MRFRGVIFDKDGTLFDFAATWSAWAGDFIESLAGGDAALAEALSTRLGYELDTRRFLPSSPVIAQTPEHLASLVLPLLPWLDPPGLIDHINATAARAPQVESVPLRALLCGLRQTGYRIGLATNDAEAPARAHLERAGIVDLFDFIAGYDSGYGAKPDPGQLRAFERMLGLPEKSSVMVGDSRHDLEAGRAAGMATVAVLTGVATRRDLEPYSDVVLPDVGALPDWLALQETKRHLLS